MTRASNIHSEAPASGGLRATASADRSAVQKRRRGALALSVGTVVVAAGGLGAWMLRPAPLTSAPASWVSVSEHEVAKTVSATGTVRLKIGSTVRIGSQLSGIVQRLNVTVGSAVKRGDVIATIDARPIEAKVGQAQAQLVRDQVLAAKAQIDLSRATKLANRGWISGQGLDDARSTARVADATLATARADLNAASVDLHYVDIRAPISGTVASVTTQQGETVAAAFSTPTFVTIIQPDALEVVALVDEADIGDVRVGQPAEFTVESWPDRTFEGRVVRIAPAATIISGVINYEVAIEIDSDVAGLRPDMTANVTIATARSKAVSVPAGALRRTPSGTMVEVRGPGGQPVWRKVRSDQPRSGTVDIQSGLRAGEQVLVMKGVGK